MPFGTLTNGTISFAPLTAGLYRANTVTFGDPVNDFRISPAGRPNKDGAVRSAYQRVIEKDVTVGDTTTREVLTVTTSVNTKPGVFTTAEIDAAISDHNTIITADLLSRSLQGES
jgi:hypothetical protein